MKVALIMLVAAACVAVNAYAHGSPYVVFTCRFLDASGRPVSGLTVALELRSEQGGKPLALAEAPILHGVAKVNVAFPGDFRGRIRMRVMDAKRRTVAQAAGQASEFPYEHRSGTGLEAAFAAAPRSPAADPLKDGEAGLGADGRICPRPEAARTFRLDWAYAHTDPAEAAEAARGTAIDRGIETDFRERLAEIRKRREGK